jgi:hypothetical protein
MIPPCWMYSCSPWVSRRSVAPNRDEAIAQPDVRERAALITSWLPRRDMEVELLDQWAGVPVQVMRLGAAPLLTSSALR